MSPGIRNSWFGKPVTAASGNGSYAQRGYAQVSYSGLPVMTGSLFPFKERGECGQTVCCSSLSGESDVLTVQKFATVAPGQP
jgi:hypothetical protein